MPANILVVDDDPAALVGLVELLQQAGYAAIGASSFVEAKQRLAERAPDLLITDVRLGAFNGLQLVVRGRIQHPEMAAIVTTGFSDAVIESEARRHGAVFFVKPISPDALLEAVSTELARQAGAEPCARVMKNAE